VLIVIFSNRVYIVFVSFVVYRVGKWSGVQGKELIVCTRWVTENMCHSWISRVSHVEWGMSHMLCREINSCHFTYVCCLWCRISESIYIYIYIYFEWCATVGNIWLLLRWFFFKWFRVSDCGGWLATCLQARSIAHAVSERAHFFFPRKWDISHTSIGCVTHMKESRRMYRVSKTHRIPYLYRSISAKVTYIYWLFCGKWSAT